MPFNPYFCFPLLYIKVIDFIHGKVEELNPAFVVLASGGVGYGLHISLQTFEVLRSQTEVKLFAHPIIREDEHLLFGFADRAERAMFRHLISVSGIGANTARLILSSLGTKDVFQAIISGNLALIRSIKGIGDKTAQRILLDLQDRLKKEAGVFAGPASTTLSAHHANSDEAAAALTMLGFNRTAVEKALARITQQNPNLEVEELVKQSLKIL